MDVRLQHHCHLLPSPVPLRCEYKRSWNESRATTTPSALQHLPPRTRVETGRRVGTYGRTSCVRGRHDQQSPRQKSGALTLRNLVEGQRENRGRFSRNQETRIFFFIFVWLCLPFLQPTILKLGMSPYLLFSTHKGVSVGGNVTNTGKPERI